MIPASGAAKPAGSVAWWWFALGALTAMALVVAPRAVRERAAAYFKR
jgi:hypothetical protein